MGRAVMLRFLRFAGLMGLVAAAVLLPLGFARGDGPSTALSGTLRLRHGDVFGTSPREASETAVLDTGHQIVKVKVAPGAKPKPGSRVRVEGVYDNQTLVGAAGGTTTLAAPAAVTGNRTVAVVLFNFANNSIQPWTPATAQSVVFDSTSSVNAYYQTASRGTLSLSGTVFGWYTIPLTNSACNFT